MLVRLRQFLGRVLRLGYGLVGALLLEQAKGPSAAARTC